MTGFVVHQALLADLSNLAKLWGVSEKHLGLEINAEGSLVPVIIGVSDETASVSEMIEVALETFPDSQELDWVVQVYATNTENRMVISTVDRALSVQERSIGSHWWTFTDDYRDDMH